jgi:lauroyl/myristoyl acyltransferase
MRGGLRLTRGWSNGSLQRLGRVVAAVGRGTPPLRRMLVGNVKAALGEAPAGVDRVFFRSAGRWIDLLLAVDHRGLDASGALERFELDGSVEVLAGAHRLGRGVVLLSPHLFGFEIGAGVINRRVCPVVGLQREGRQAWREGIKDRWYRQAGYAVVRRPRRASAASDAWRCLEVLRSGRALGLTPDVIVKPERGERVRLLGREVTLSPGAMLLARWSGSPVVSCIGRERDDGRVTLCFSGPIEVDGAGEARAAARLALQRWCVELESELRARPGYWMQWLDKRWSEVWASPPGEGPAR